MYYETNIWQNYWEGPSPLYIPQEILFNLYEAWAGKFVITPERLGFLAHNFVLVANFLLSNF